MQDRLAPSDEIQTRDSWVSNPLAMYKIIPQYCRFFKASTTMSPATGTPSPVTSRPTLPSSTEAPSPSGPSATPSPRPTPPGKTLFTYTLWVELRLVLLVFATNLRLSEVSGRTYSGLSSNEIHRILVQVVPADFVKCPGISVTLTRSVIYCPPSLSAGH